MNSNWSYSLETPNLGQHWRFNSRVTLKFEIWPWKAIGHFFLCYFKLFASFRSHWWIQTWVTVRKRLIWVKIEYLFNRVTSQFHGWTWKIIRHHFYATSSFVHHFVAIGEFKLDLQSWNAQFGSKLTIFFRRVTLQFDQWPWKTIGHLVYATSSFVHRFVAIGGDKLRLHSWNAQFWSKSTIF